MVGRIGAPDVYVHTADNIAAAYGEGFRANNVLRAQLTDWEAGNKRLWFEMDDHRDYAEAVGSRMKEMDEAQMGGQIATVGRVLHDRLWGSVLTMTGLMHDRGVVTEPDVLDNAVGIALMWRSTPELFLRGLEKRGDATALIEAAGFTVPAFYTDPFPYKTADLPRIPAVRSSVDEATGIATVTINRPRYTNAVNQDAVVDLHRIADEISRNPAVKTVVLRGAGKNFVAGADIGWFAARQAEGPAGLAKIHDEFVRPENEAMAIFKQDGRLLVVVADGSVVGGGVEMTGQADFVVAVEGLEGERTRFNMPEASLGISNGYDTVDLPRRVGVAMAKRILMTGAQFGSREGMEMGFVDAVIRRDRLSDYLAMVDRTWRAMSDAGSPKEDFVSSMRQERPASSDRLEKLQALWTDNDAVRCMVLGQVPPWLTGNEQKLAESEVALIRRGSPQAIAMMNRMIDEGTRFDLRAGLIELFDTAPARCP